MIATTTRRAATGALTLAAATALLLGGCATDDGAAADTPTGGATPATAAADALTVTDPWVKAADDGMTAAFAVLENTGDADVTVVSASTPASPDVQLHETVEDASGQMAMRERDGGFVVPAGGSLELAPGGDHLMLMGLAAPIEAGDEVTLTLTLDDGSTLDVTAVAKDYSGAQENYQGGEDGDSGGMGDMSGDGQG
ncbi:copper chaperone PCu(A)C [Xylanimonas ulmi]|uniref:Copper(I)-binding protein n=1 Tax=Xylanimonas ulmi TaxID=228973 RepID=A0A4Q7M039_9MICO|nr:copper chaperone PCu(A)C [Xylanibacterium ulmi]RZS60223.1 hypothetical protein EV386_0475 [Xylanibacterium ulmi]